MKLSDLVVPSPDDDEDVSWAEYVSKENSPAVERGRERAREALEQVRSEREAAKDSGS